MTIEAPLKLIALDADDLMVISAHVQDAVLKVRDLLFEPRTRRFALTMRRFAWEAAPGGGRRFERRLSVLHFDRVLSVQSCRLNRDAPEGVLELLAVEFAPADPPTGHVILHFAGGPEVRLEVECMEARLADLGAAWQTTAMPAHDLQDRPSEAPDHPAK